MADENTINELNNLKSEVVDSLMPLMENNTTDDSSKFTIALAAARDSKDASKYRRAFEIANSIEDETERTDALMELLGELDIEIQHG